MINIAEYMDLKDWLNHYTLLHELCIDNSGSCSSEFYEKAYAEHDVLEQKINALLAKIGDHFE